MMDQHYDSAAVTSATETAREQRESWLALFRVATRLSADLDAPDIANRAVSLVVELLPGVDAALLWLVNRSDRRLALMAADGSSAGPLHESLRQYRIVVEPGMGGPGAALGQRQSQVFSSRESYFDDLRTLGAMGEPLRRFAADLEPSLRVMRVPLLLGRTAVGVLELVTLRPDTAPLLNDLPLLQAFSDQLAVALRNAQLYAETATQQRRLEAFDAIVAAIASANDTQTMLERVLPAMLQLADARDGLIAVVEEGTARVAAVQGVVASVAAPDDRLDPDAALLGEAHLQPLDMTHPWSSLREHGIESLAIVPLLAGTVPVGFLAIAVPDDGDALPEWSALQALGTQIAVAIVNQQLYSVGMRERRRLGSVIASLHEGVVICDRLGRIVLTNPAASAILKRRLDDVRTRTELMDALNMRDLDDRPLAPTKTPLARTLHGESYTDYEIRVTGGTDEAAILSFAGAPLLADDGTIDGGVIVFRDLTLQKQHDAARDEFLAVAAHELRAPLAAIKGYADLLVQRESQRPDATERDRRGIGMLSRQIDHLVRLVDNLLNMSRLDAGRFDLYLQPVDLITLVEASIDRVSVGDANHTFVFNGPETLTVVCDQLRMQQVLTNLLSNAARYSAPGTQITVDVWTESCAIEDGVVSGGRGVDQCVAIAVRDQGVGMTPEVQAKVFERYFRANTSTSASGLGLGVYITREIVLRHGGKLWLESEVGKGTAFYVMLPLQPPRAE